MLVTSCKSDDHAFDGDQYKFNDQKNDVFKMVSNIVYRRALNYSKQTMTHHHSLRRVLSQCDLSSNLMFFFSKSIIQ